MWDDEYVVLRTSRTITPSLESIGSGGGFSTSDFLDNEMSVESVLLQTPDLSLIHI